MGKIANSFILVGVLAAASHHYHASLPLFAGPLALPDAVPSTGEDYDILSAATAVGNSTAWESPGNNAQTARQLREAEMRVSIGEQIDWINSLVEPIVPSTLWDALPRFWKCWLRNEIFSILVYFGVGFTWAYYIYTCFGSDLFPKGNMPNWRDVSDQMSISFWALPIYSLMPTITEELCERGYTLVYPHIADVGVPMFLANIFLYMAFVEFGVYWMHRGLHDIPAGYKYLHATHHKYNKEHSMSPFAGLAFHPIDGILQALPYALALFVVPMHFLTHGMLLFMTALWTTNIHDNIHGNVLPVMGAGWHTIHHTSYKHNYGHYFVIMDWLFDTLISPEEYEAQTAARRAASRAPAPAHGAAAPALVAAAS